MSWRSAWRISDVAFTEISLQAIYAFRQGNLPPSIPAKALVPRARRRVTQSKLLVSFVLGLVALGALVALSAQAENLVSSELPRGIYVGAVLTGLLVLELALLWWTGLQVLPTYLGSGVLDLLETLPVQSRTLDRVALIVLLRLFDAPALTCLILTPLAVGIALNSALAGLAIVPGVVAAVAFALVLALLTGRFFLRRIQGARGGGGHSAVRWAYLVLWAVPAFAMYGLISVAPQFFQLLTTLVTQGPSTVLDVALVTFPFPLALLPSYAVGGFGALSLSPTTDAAVLVGAAIYSIFVVQSVRWLLIAPRRLTHLPSMATTTGSVTDLRLSTGGVGWAILVKDLRTASRTPGYAFLILLPLLDAVAIGLWTYVSNPSPSDVFNLGAAAVATAALLASFFGPAFFAIEVMGYSYTRTLPLPDRSLLLGKVYLVAAIYLLASGLVLGLTLLRVFSPILFLAFIAAEFPGILAAAFLELGILFRRARKSGLPIVNLYSGAWWAVAVAVPGLIVAGLPIVLFQFLRQSSGGFAIPGMGALAVAELALCAPFALGLGGRGAH